MVNLEIEELKNGVLKCFSNSKSLLSDADYLFEDNRFARAYSIYILCIEEVQKTFMLFRILLEKESDKKNTKKENEYYSKFFSSHTLKIKAAAAQGGYYNDFAEKHSLKKVKTSKEIRNEFDNPKQKDIFKQQGFYVDLVHKKFKEPGEMINIEKCNKIQNEAKLSLSHLNGWQSMFFSNPNFFIRKYITDDFKILRK
jgi:AbiV family abortive infection protein|tara:strand:- start:438 stop:1031 length:594 start_codon:yes stop_codon:yes gene_type:complete